MRLPSIVVGLALSFHVMIAFGQDQRTLAVVGKAEYDATPDLATLELGVIFRDRDLTTAKDSVDKFINAIV